MPDHPVRSARGRRGGRGQGVSQIDVVAVVAREFSDLLGGAPQYRGEGMARLEASTAGGLPDRLLELAPGVVHFGRHVVHVAVGTPAAFLEGALGLGPFVPERLARSPILPRWLEGLFDGLAVLAEVRACRPR